MRTAKTRSQNSRIRVRNLNRSHKINETFMKKIALAVLKYLRLPRDTELEIIFMTNAEIKSLNRRYKGADRPTDVLSFKLDRREFGSNIFLGEIFISLDTALANAKEFGTRFEEETVLYVIHAILHLFGYDDRTEIEKRRMSKKERETLDYLCKKEDLSKVLMPR